MPWSYKTFHPTLLQWAFPQGSSASLPPTATFTINSGNFLLIGKGTTVHEPGRSRTTLAKTGPRHFQEVLHAKLSPPVMVRPVRVSYSETAGLHPP